MEENTTKYVLNMKNRQLLQKQLHINQIYLPCALATKYCNLVSMKIALKILIIIGETSQIKVQCKVQVPILM